MDVAAAAVILFILLLTHSHNAIMCDELFDVQKKKKSRGTARVVCI